MALRAAFKSVEKDEEGRIWWAIEMIDVDKIAIWRFPAFAAQFERGRLDQQGPDRLGMAAGQPGRGQVGLQCRVCGQDSAIAWWPSSAAEAWRLSRRQPWAPRP